MKIAFFSAEDINLGVGYLMALLREQGNTVELFFDPLQFNRAYASNNLLSKIFNLENYNIKRLKKFKPDLVCFSCVTATYQWGLKLAEKIKKQIGCKIVFGGIHATLVPEEVKKHNFIDEVVVGDGFEYFGQKFDPDKLWPDRESFYKELPKIHRQYPIFMTSFGCPFNCSFCGNDTLRNVKQYKHLQRNPDKCIEELKYLKQKGAKHVLFVDDIFIFNHDFLRDFLPKYEQEIALPFTCFGHAKSLNEEVCKSLKKSGCQTIWIGIQSGDERLRKDILFRYELNKDIIEACKAIKNNNMNLMIDHIFGIPSENIMSQDISYNLYNEIKPNIVNCYELVYFPKAKIIEYGLRTGNLIPKDIQNINEGKGIRYQLGNKNKKFFDEYAKSFFAIPLGGVGFELLPTIIIKILNNIRAKRSYIFRVVIENEIYFTLRAIWKKLKLFLQIV
jgi:radical SAM superfamily enzyme YgiQ (UPF0313 family)